MDVSGFSRRPVRARLRAGKQRRGAAIVEMAVVTPVLLTLVLGVIEFSWAMSVQQSLTNAAREGCRTAVIKGSTDQDILDRVNGFMSPTGLTCYWVEMTRATVPDPTESVTVSIYYADISLVAGYFPGLEEKILTATCSMRKEGS